MKKIFVILILILVSNLVFSQKRITYNADSNRKIDSLHKSNVEYKVQILSSTYIDSGKFKHYFDTHRCEVEFFRTKENKEVYRYLIFPDENSLESANILLDQLSKDFLNPFIVQYNKGKRIN